MASAAAVRKVPTPIGSKSAKWLLSAQTVGGADAPLKPIGYLVLDQGAFDAMPSAHKTAFNAMTITAITAVTAYYGTKTEI